MLIHILLEILLAEFKNEDELCFAMDNIVKANDVGMLELFHQRDLTNRRGGCPFFCIQVNLLECHDLVCCARPTLDKAEGGDDTRLGQLTLNTLAYVPSPRAKKCILDDTYASKKLADLVSPAVKMLAVR